MRFDISAILFALMFAPAYGGDAANLTEPWTRSAASAAAPLALPSATFVGGVSPPLHTRGRYFYDARGARVRLRCASWSGMQERWFVPSGMWAQDRSAIARMARKARLNCVRLVWSLEAVLRSANGTAAVPAAAVSANRDLAGKAPLQVGCGSVAQAAHRARAAPSSNAFATSRVPAPCLMRLARLGF